MMLPATAFSSSSSSSANSAVVRVDKATSEFLNGPDWTINIDICDTINANPWLVKDVVKALKKRLQHKNSHVQLLSLTLLETMVKNCGDNVHYQIAERNILPEMIKIVKKKTDMRVREKILVLLDSWQEAFGGRGGKYPQYYFAYDELRQAGVQFPHRSPDAAPIFTPPVTHHPSVGPTQPNYGMPSNSSTRLDEAMASEIENLSMSVIESMRNVSDLLSEMLQEVDPNDRAAIKDEVIVDVVDRCRSNQKKLMQMLASTSDEELLGQGIELNDNLQTVLAKHDAIASGSPIPAQLTNSIASPSNTNNTLEPQIKSTEEKENLKSTVPVAAPPPVVAVPPPSGNDGDDEEDEDDFALLARRHSKAQVGPTSDPSLSMALTITDPPPPLNTTKADDMIDFLSLTLSSPNPPSPPPVTTSHDQSPPVSTTAQQQQQHYPHQPQPSMSSYVVPWAQSEPQHQHQPPPQPPPVQPQYQQQNLSPGGYIPPPWAATPGYYTNPYQPSPMTYSYPTPSYNNINNTSSQQVNLYSNRAAAGGVSGDSQVAAGGGGGSQRPFIPSYRLFEDLNVLGNPNTTSGSSSGESMLGGRK
ncbi:unnamed protein product [Lactuca saligna]|uniref:VHS domain-containing protein n=1 Tax=Lactuca saligna TaxID=75948 RepID=A0AA35ZUJ8_LACSI|nr:unnamed protein product [Lactuca saligna]